MNNILSNALDIINNISGYHQYVLSAPVHLSYVSDNLCKMIEAEKVDLLCEDKDLYIRFVHPEDTQTYTKFLESLKADEKTLSCEYRMIKSNGQIIFVNDTATSKRLSDGTIVCDSVLSDISKIKNENNNLQFLNSTIPCGFIKYTCEKQPRVTYINKQMMDLLRFPESGDGEIDYFEMYKNNIFLMIPMEERRRFALYLNRVYSAGTPIAGEISMLRCDGTRAYVFGWVTKCVNEQGIEEFQSVCMDVTQRHQAKKAFEAKRYIKALSDIYDKVFEYDLSANTVTCLYSNNSPMFKWLENIPMQMDEATEKWITGTVVDEQKEEITKFFDDFRQKKLYKAGDKPPQITYKAKSSSGEIKNYNGVFLKIDDSISIYCCRSVQDTKEVDALKNENVSLKENMQELVVRFSEGIAAFEITDKFVKPLYTSENACQFFGLKKEDWYPLMDKSTPIKDFVSKSDVNYDAFLELLRVGEAEFTYYDVHKQNNRRIKAICSPKSPLASPRYVLLYNVDEVSSAQDELKELSEIISIRTFGYFDVFVGDKPIAFRNKKSKELFALLVDRRGGYVTSEEAISFLWEDEPVNSVTLARYRKVALRLKNTLEEYGISHIVESVDGKRRIVTERVQCDLYDYLSGKSEFSQLFKGSYLTNYSWGETTLAELSVNTIF